MKNTNLRKRRIPDFQFPDDQEFTVASLAQKLMNEIGEEVSQASVRLRIIEAYEQKLLTRREEKVGVGRPKFVYRTVSSNIGTQTTLQKSDEEQFEDDEQKSAFFKD